MMIEGEEKLLKKYLYVVFKLHFTSRKDGNKKNKNKKDKKKNVFLLKNHQNILY